MEEIQNEGADLEEKQQEQELLKETPADEVQKSILDKFGLDEEVDNELVNKLVENELESRKKLSTAIKQKIGWRTKAEAHIGQKPEEKPQPPVVQPKEDIAKLIDQRFEEKEFDSFDLSDEGRNAIKAYAKAANLTVKQVQQSDYFKFLKDKEESAKKVEEASIGGKRGAPARKDFDSTKPTEFDLSTEEGQKEYEDYKEWRKKKS